MLQKSLLVTSTNCQDQKGPQCRKRTLKKQDQKGPGPPLKKGGSTNDITAYKQTKLFQWFLDKRIPECFHQVLDEAHSSIGGMQHLFPFSRHQLQSARDVSIAK